MQTTAVTSPGQIGSFTPLRAARRVKHVRPPLFILLPAAAVAVAMALPLVYLILRAAGAGGADLLFHTTVVQTLGRTLLLIVSVTAASIAIAVPIAWLTVRTDLPFRRFWGVVTVLPLVVPTYVGGFIIVVALGPRGMLQGLLENLFGVERIPDFYGFPGAMLTLTILSFPYVVFPVRAALWRLDPALEETSLGLGSSARTTFFRVTLPLLRPAILAGGLLVALYTLSDFGAVSLLQYETFTWSIFVQYESSLDRSLASFLSLMLVVLALGIVSLEAMSRGKSKYYRSTNGAVRPVSMVRLGRWRWPALALCAAVGILALALPLGVLSYWTVRGVLAGEPLLLLWSAAQNSLLISGLAALVSVAAALPIAILAARHPGWTTSVLERMAFVGFALPGVVIALALVYFGAKFASPFYQTHALLVLAYLVLFLPAGLSATKTSLLQVSPQMEEAAHSLGSSPFRVFSSITAPLVRPGILAGGALVFLLTMKELPATLILGPIGFETLAASIWSATSEAYFAQAAAPALLLILAASIPMAFLILRGHR